MSTAIVYDAIKARLIDQINGAYPVRDYEEIEVFLQQGTEPWLALQGAPARQTPMSLGAPQQNWISDDGYVDIHCFVPSSDGLDPARQILQSVRDFTQFYYFDMPAGQTLRTMTVSAPQSGIIFNGLWHSMNIALAYRHRYTAATAAA